MLCFEIWLNGKRLGVIGHNDALTLSAEVMFHNKNDSQFLGLSSITNPEGAEVKDCSWEAPQLGAGDEVLIKLVQSNTPMPPDHELLFAQRMPWPWGGNVEQCSFCGSEAAEGLGLFEGHDARICSQCIEFRHRIISGKATSADDVGLS